MPMQQMFLGGGGIPGPDIDEVFHINTYSGNQSNRSFNTGLDFSTHGGFIWNSVRNVEFNDRGVTKSMPSEYGTNVFTVNQGGGTEANSSWFKTWDSNGYSIGTNTSDNTDGLWNKNSHNYVNWGWRNCDNFFKEFTYTGNGTDSGQTITHGLGSTPGFIIVKRIEDNGSPTHCWHKEMSQNKLMPVGPNDLPRAFNYHSGPARSWSVNSTTFNAPNGPAYETNVNNKDYIGMVFADHSSEGTFGGSGTKKAIICSKFTGNGTSSNSVTVGFQPQWLLVKAFGGADPTSGQWWVFDDERGFSNSMKLSNSVENDDSSSGYCSATSTGFTINTSDAHINENNTEYLYIAIAAST